ncbi:MAG TPA: hypothetical protein VI336_02610 [Candidatus Saccharimonadales bacterium]|nr:hypothetical protein [Candidatus Saccharimonadales bacterium]
MDVKKFIIQHSKTWKRPDEAYFDYQDQAKDIDPDEIEWNGKHKRIRELRDLAIFGMALYDLYNTPFFVQMNEIDDSPDAFVMRQSPNEELTNDIGPVELTFYGRNKLGMPSKSLVDKLSEPGGKFTKLPDGYCLVVHIGKGLSVDHEAVTQKLKSISAKFQAFSLQEISNYPDTIARFVVYSPECQFKDINIGEMGEKFKGSGIFGEVTQVRGRPPVN